MDINASRFMTGTIRNTQSNALVCRILAETAVTSEGRAVLQEMAENYAVLGQPSPSGRLPALAGTSGWRRD